MVQKIKDGVYSVGAVDWNVRSFHGYTTPKGATYNAYLIIDEKIALIDTCKRAFAGELIKNISELIPPEKVDYIICNHAEPDHSGALPEVKRACKNAQIIAAAVSGAKDLRLHYGDMPISEVKSGETLSLGKRELKFVTTPMVHWPDNMVTYDEYDKILFSNDAFGEHYAFSDIFDYNNDINEVLKEAKKYYANIVLPYSAQAKKALTAAEELNFDTICPSHGVVWQKYLGEIAARYKSWTSCEKENTAVIAYETMWHSSELMAGAIARAFQRKGVKVKLYNLDCNHPSDIMTELMSASYLAVGSPTLNNNLMPLAAGFLTYVRGLAPANLKGFAFGSYGWSGQSIGQVEDMLKAAKVEIIHPPVKVQFVPDEKALAEIEESVFGVL